MTTEGFDRAVAADGEEFAFHNDGQDWIVSFHPASQPRPEGRNHGSSGFCFTPEGQTVLVSKGDVPTRAGRFQRLKGRDGLPDIGPRNDRMRGRVQPPRKQRFVWEPPGGRPEGGESLRETLDREVLEEASARVQDAVLLGYSQGMCTNGHELGLVIVRSLWWAAVEILPHVPDYEMKHRLLCRRRKHPPGLASSRCFLHLIMLHGLPATRQSSGVSSWTLWQFRLAAHSW